MPPPPQNIHASEFIAISRQIKLRPAEIDDFVIATRHVDCFSFDGSDIPEIVPSITHNHFSGCRCDTALKISKRNPLIIADHASKSGGEGGTRTPDPAIMSRVL